MKSSCEVVEKPKTDHYYEAKHNVSTNFEKNKSINATNDSENSKSKLIQSFMESQQSTSPPKHMNTANKNYELNISHENEYNSLTGENSFMMQTSDEFYKEGIEHWVPMMPGNESTIPDNTVGDIFKIRNYIPASQRKIELKARYVPRLVSLSFYMQVARCYKIVAQFDKLLTCETFSNLENNMLRKKVQFVQYPEFENSYSVQSDSNFSSECSDGTEELILEINDDDLQTEDELESMSDYFEQNQKILEEIENKVENCSVEGKLFRKLENNDEIEQLTTSVTTISNPVYVVIMDANEKNSSSLIGKAEICRIESSRFSEIILNEISGVDKKLIVGSEPLKLAKNDKNSDVERRNKSISIDKSKKHLIPSQSRDKIKYRASSVCLPSGMNKYHTKRNSNSPRVRFSQSNVVINRPKINSQVTVSKEYSDVKNEVPSKSRIVKDKSSSIESPENLNSQLMSIRDEIRELKNLFAKR